MTDKPVDILIEGFKRINSLIGGYPKEYQDIAKQALQEYNKAEKDREDYIRDALYMSVEKFCSKYQLQNCHRCCAVECGDNMNPIVKELRELRKLKAKKTICPCCEKETNCKPIAYKCIECGGEFETEQIILDALVGKS